MTKPIKHFPGTPICPHCGGTGILRDYDPLAEKRIPEICFMCEGTGVFYMDGHNDPDL